MEKLSNPPSQELTFLNLFKLILILMLASNIVFVLLPSIELRAQSDEEVMHSPCTLELRHTSNPKDPCTKAKACELNVLHQS